MHVKVHADIQDWYIFLLQVQVWTEQYMPKPGERKGKVKFRFKKGDLVRFTYQRTVFSRGFHQSHTEEIFKIHEVHKTIPPTYSCVDLLGERIEGIMYNQDMVLFDKKEKDISFRIEKVLAKRTVKGKKQVLLRWLGYSKKFDTWEDADKIKDLGKLKFDD